MNVEKINLNLVKFSKSYGSNINLFFNGKKIVIKTPIIKTINGIESDNKNKFYMRLDMSNHPVLVSFLRQIDSINRSNDILELLGNGDKKYINCFYYNNNSWKVKLPSKYGRYNFDVIDNEGNLIPTSSISGTEKLECDIELSNIWNFNNSYGCIWNVKKIKIC